MNSIIIKKTLISFFNSSFLLMMTTALFLLLQYHPNIANNGYLSEIRLDRIIGLFGFLSLFNIISFYFRIKDKILLKSSINSETIVYRILPLLIIFGLYMLCYFQGFSYSILFISITILTFLSIFMSLILFVITDPSDQIYQFLGIFNYRKTSMMVDWLGTSQFKDLNSEYNLNKINKRSYFIFDDNNYQNYCFIIFDKKEFILDFKGNLHYDGIQMPLKELIPFIHTEYDKDISELDYNDWNFIRMVYI